MKIIRCKCGHPICSKFEFFKLIEGKFELDQIPEMIQALKDFGKPTNYCPAKIEEHRYLNCECSG